MGKSLNMRVVAEGVETREQSAFLQNQHCPEAQGFYFGAPVIPEKVTELLEGELRGLSPALMARQ
jgi:EAL domain-containing protein (putative c-di-GMP-specific phosphodiesterase class I)